jgi:hypothetical protein
MGEGDQLRVILRQHLGLGPMRQVPTEVENIKRELVEAGREAGGRKLLRYYDRVNRAVR